MIKIILRWLCVPVSALILAFIAVGGSRGIVNLADTRCAAENMMGGACVEPWHTGFVELTIYFGIIFAAFTLSLIPSAIAPAFKRTVAVIAGVLPAAGLGTFYYFTQWPQLILPMIVAVTGSTLCITWVWSRSKQNVLD